MPHYDVIIATDIHIPGGPSGSTLEEIRVQHAAGLRTGLCHLPSSTMRREKPVHPGLAACLKSGACELVGSQSDASAKLLLFRSPTLIDHLDGALPTIAAENVVLVVNHPPVHAAGRVDYLLPYVRARLRTAYAREPEIFPVGPILRAAIEKYYDGIPLLEATDWTNIFNLKRFATARTEPREPIRIGRHSRDVREKWPSKAEDILGAYPEKSDVDVRILGGSSAVEKVLGRRPANWTVHEFGTRPPEEFLREIDVFVYFHHPQWIELFGRTVIEAMASGLPPILGPQFRPLCLDAATYCEPMEVGSHIERLRDPREYREHSQRAAAYAERYGDEVHLRRLRSFGLL